MERAASFLLLGLVTLLTIHVIQDPDGAKRYGMFLLTGKGPNGGIGETSTVSDQQPAAPQAVPAPVRGQPAAPTRVPPRVPSGAPATRPRHPLPNERAV